MAHVALILLQPYAKRHRVSNVASLFDSLLFSRGREWPERLGTTQAFLECTSAPRTLRHRRG
jgi:hypothetical protein